MDWTKALDILVKHGTEWGLRLVGVLIALFIGKLVAGAASRSLARALQKRGFDATLTKFFSNLTRYAIIAAVVIGCLGVFGIQTASFAAVIGAAGLAVGLALQGTLSHFASGVMLLIFRPFKVDDLVKVAGELGIIVSIDLFTTEIRTLDNRQLIIPNGGIFGKTIENLTGYDTRRVDVSVGVSYDHSADEAREVLDTAAANIKGALSDPAPQVFLKELGASSVDWEVRIWCKTDDYWDVHQEIIRTVKAKLDDAQVSIPFPQMDLHLDNKVVDRLGAPRAA